MNPLEGTNSELPHIEIENNENNEVEVDLEETVEAPPLYKKVKLSEAMPKKNPINDGQNETEKSTKSGKSKSKKDPSKKTKEKRDSSKGDLTR